jgi:hypothetical protein
MGSDHNRESELQVCARLLRALAHRVRGDLSVITNDLAYIATMVNPAEVERARARCGRISAGLAHMSALSVSDVKAQTPLSEVTRIFGILDGEKSCFGGGRVETSQGLLEHAVVLLRELIGEWDAFLCGETSSESIELLLKARTINDFTGCYASLGSYTVAQVGERFVVEAGLIDLILRDHGWAVAVVCEDHRATIRLTVPSVRE